MQSSSSSLITSLCALLCLAVISSAHAGRVDGGHLIQTFPAQVNKDRIPQGQSTIISNISEKFTLTHIL